MLFLDKKKRWPATERALLMIIKAGGRQQKKECSLRTKKLNVTIFIQNLAKLLVYSRSEWVVKWFLFFYVRLPDFPLSPRVVSLKIDAISRNKKASALVTNLIIYFFLCASPNVFRSQNSVMSKQKPVCINRIFACRSAQHQHNSGLTRRGEKHKYGVRLAQSCKVVQSTFLNLV